jgi:type IV pilus assembly protein PilY1
MNDNKMMTPVLSKVLCCAILIFGFVSNVTNAEDIELYVGSTDQRSGAKPQVLIIFDNSGSMAGIMSTKASYDPATTYPAVGSDNSLNERFVYFTKGSGVDSSIPFTGNGETRRFLDDINGCHTAALKLADVGFYTGHIREYAFSGNTGSWQEIPDNNGANIDVIDCWDDVRLSDPVNAKFIYPNGTESTLPSGYPIDGAGNKLNPVYYTADIADSNTNIGSGEVVTLYTDNYLRWYHGTEIEMVDSTKLAVAKNTINDLLNSAPSVDFGLELFNMDYPREGYRDGGRIVSGIQEMTDTTRTALINTIENIDAETNTPLCESLFEAYRYFAGKSVLFGDNDSDYYRWYDGNTPARDTSVESNGVYLTPYNACSNEINVILITDGQPTQDHAADTSSSRVSETFTPITGLAGMGAPFDYGSGTSYLPALSKWMNENDINSNLAGDQTVTLYTVGFGEDAITDAGTLLEAAATGKKSDGTVGYYPAEDATALASALRSALIGILNSTSTFSSPAIASNNFDRTRSLDSIYYAMFLPERGPRWRGNLKKLRLVGQTQQDADGNVAISASGNIEDTARTYWSSTADGNEVSEGGVVEMFSGLNLTNRTLYSNIGSGSGFGTLTKANAAITAGSTAALATYMGVLEDELDNNFDWVKGYDIDDDDNDTVTTDNRSDIFGDPLHSKPLVINYGPASNPDIRVVVGTNAGFFHMFDDNGTTITESWAFMPYELLPNIKLLRDNIAGSDKVYGMDASPMSYILDNNGDGLIDASDGDKAWIFTGMRRGGSSYYAIDVTLPDSPSFMWKLSPSDTGMSEMGQSWSKPSLAFVKNNVTDGEPNPSLIIGGGYSTNKDGTSTTTDPSGKAIYIIDAQTKALKWSLTPAVTAGVNTSFSGIVDGIPGEIKTMDSDFDGYVDRLYSVDVGGNVWRVDMPGSDPTSSTTPWTSFKLAELGGAGADDRRFFSAPAVARSFFSHVSETEITNADSSTETITIRKEIPFDGVLVGSGNRSHPNDTTINDSLYMLQDRNVITKSYVDELPAAILPTNLYDITSNPFGAAATDDEWIALEVDLSGYLGWKFSLSASGEKSLSSASVIGGVAYYTSFTPAAAISDNACVLLAGEGTLYALNMHFGTAVYDQITYSVGDKIPDTPELFLGEDGDGDSELLLVGTDSCEGSASDCTAGVFTLKPIPSDPTPCGDSCTTSTASFGIRTFRNYIYVTEGAEGH